MMSEAGKDFHCKEGERFIRCNGSILAQMADLPLPTILLG